MACQSRQVGRAVLCAPARQCNRNGGQRTARPTLCLCSRRVSPLRSRLATPVRKKLPHTVPQWIADGSWFFITINCVPRGKNQLCRSDTGQAVLCAIKFNHERFIWHCRLCLLMPDHLHPVIAFPREPGMQTSIKNWKKFVAGKTRRGLATRFFRSPLA